MWIVRVACESHNQHVVGGSHAGLSDLKSVLTWARDDERTAQLEAQVQGRDTRLHTSCPDSATVRPQQKASRQRKAMDAGFGEGLLRRLLTFIQLTSHHRGDQKQYHTPLSINMTQHKAEHFRAFLAFILTAGGIVTPTLQNRRLSPGK